MTVFGWDISDFDADRGPVDLAVAARAGIQFVTHKATEGTKTKHARFGAVMARARAAGIQYLGAYMVPRTPGNAGHGTVEQQAAYFLDYVQASAPWWHDFPGWFWQVDLEHWSNANGVYDAVAPAHGVRMCQLLRDLTGRRVVLYAPRWAYGDTIPGTDPLWASAYGTNGVAGYRELYPGDSSNRWAPYSGRTPMILQYSSRAIIGSQGTCDANAFRGSTDDFHRFITGRNLAEMANLDEIERTSGNADRYLWQGIGQLADPIQGINNGAARVDVPNELARALRRIETAVNGLANRPPASFTDDQIAQLAAALTAHTDTPLDADDQPVIEAALKSVLQSARLVAGN